MRFIDLFAGLGGFHLALKALSHDCVFASENDPGLKEIYQKNFEMPVSGDIRDIPDDMIPEHDILCAGFPCQPFSKAGAQDGFDHATDGTLFHEILRVLRHHTPEFVILENVANFELHDGGNTWKVASGSLKELGYDVAMKKLSPHELGVPQIRERVFIVGRRGSLGLFTWPKSSGKTESVTSVIEVQPREAKPIPENLSRALSVWQAFLDEFPRDKELPSFPIWSMEFGASYPDDGIDPRVMGLKDIRSLRGAHGVPLQTAARWKNLWSLLPSYANEATFPKWKQRFIQQNRELYEANREWIDRWIPRIRDFQPSFQKLEWNCHGEERDLSKYIIQARPSGLRIKRANWFPALVAMNTTQVPIIGWEQRYMTLLEGKRLQSMDRLRFLPQSESRAYAALGNAVNVEVVRLIAERLLADSPLALAPSLMPKQVSLVGVTEGVT